MVNQLGVLLAGFLTLVVGLVMADTLLATVSESDTTLVEVPRDSQLIGYDESRIPVSLAVGYLPESLGDLALEDRGVFNILCWNNQGISGRPTDYEGVRYIFAVCPYNASLTYAEHFLIEPLIDQVPLIDTFPGATVVRNFIPNCLLCSYSFRCSRLDRLCGTRNIGRRPFVRQAARPMGQDPVKASSPKS